MDPSLNIPANSDIKHVAKTHFIIRARQFVEDFADYFDDVDAVQGVRIKFIAVFGDVPKDIDKDGHTELLYKFTKIGNAYVTKLLDNFGNLVRPYKPYILERNPAVWHTLAQLKTIKEKELETAAAQVGAEGDGGGGGGSKEAGESSNLIRDLHIAELWSDCDPETQEVVWSYITQLLSYGTMYTTSALIPESMMAALNEHTKEVMNKKFAAGQVPTKDDIQQSLSEIAPKILGSMKQQDLMDFGMRIMQNPHMMQDLAGMAKTVQSNMPGLDAPNMLQNMFPGGMDSMQRMMSGMAGNMGGQMPQISSDQFTQVQSMLSTMMGGAPAPAPAPDID